MDRGRPRARSPRYGRRAGGRAPSCPSWRLSAAPLASFPHVTEPINLNTVDTIPSGSTSCQVARRTGNPLQPSLDRDRLRQVPGLVDVAATPGGHVVGEELEGQSGDEGRDELLDRWDPQHAVRQGLDLVVV